MIFERPNPKTVRGKLLTISIVSTVTAVLTFAVLVFVFDFLTFRKSMDAEMMGLAEVVGRNAQSPVLFDDPATAESLLTSLRSDPRIKAAYIYKAEGGLFASYETQGWTPPSVVIAPPTSRPSSSIHHGVLLVSAPIQVEQDTIGWVTFHVGKESARAKFLYFLVFLVFGALLAAFMGWYVSKKMQKIILEPINELLMAAKLISQERNYQFRVAKHSDDEIGDLIDAFNEMLVQINARDKDLVHARDRMEQRVVERTRELQSEVEERKRAQQVVNNLLMKISEDNEMLLRLDQLKTDFLSVVSHELRTPLTAIMGYLKLLIGGAAGPVTETQKDFLSTVTRNSERLYQLVNDLLDLSRLEAGKVQLAPTKIGITRLLESSIRNLSSLADPKGIELVLAAPPEDIILEADPSRVEQVVVNLVGNAVKFTPSKGRVEVGARSVRKDGVEGVEIWVKDNGVGISKEALPHIFDKFYQAENSSTRTISGTGLGLSITQKLVEAHGGAIAAESAEGEGSAFRVFFPKQFKGKAGTPL